MTPPELLIGQEEKKDPTQPVSPWQAFQKFCDEYLGSSGKNGPVKVFDHTWPKILSQMHAKVWGPFMPLDPIFIAHLQIVFFLRPHSISHLKVALNCVGVRWGYDT